MIHKDNESTAFQSFPNRKRPRVEILSVDATAACSTIPHAETIIQRQEEGYQGTDKVNLTDTLSLPVNRRINHSADPKERNVHKMKDPRDVQHHVMIQSKPGE